MIGLFLVYITTPSNTIEISLGLSSIGLIWAINLIADVNIIHPCAPNIYMNCFPTVFLFDSLLAPTYQNKGAMINHDFVIYTNKQNTVHDDQFTHCFNVSYIKSDCLQEKKPIYWNQIALSLVTLIPEASYSSPSSFDSACTLVKRTRAIKISTARRWNWMHSNSFWSVVAIVSG